MEIYGYVEARIGGDWHDVIRINSLLSAHSDLNGCLFGVTNYANFTPLFADRGIPADSSYDVAEQTKSFSAKHESHASWVLFSELKEVDWSEHANGYDLRVTEFDESDERVALTKWLHKPEFEEVRQKLVEQPEASVRRAGRVFKRLRLTRRDTVTDTEFPLLMSLMECLSNRYGDNHVRLVVWFE